MKLKSMLLVAIAVLLFSHPAYSEEDIFGDLFGDLFDSSGKFAVAVNVSGAIPDEDDFDTAVYLGGYVSYDILNCFGVGVESGWAGWDAKVGGLDLGDVSAFPVLANLYPKLPIDLGGEIKLVPYGVIGFGVIFWDFDESDTLKNAGVSVDLDPCFAMKYGGGLDLFLTENIAIFGEGSFLWSDADIDASAAGTTISATADTDMWIVGGGVKYQF